MIVTSPKCKFLIVSDILKLRYYVIRTNNEALLSIGNFSVNGDLVSICDTYQDAVKIFNNLTK
jgi:hypothetical protein